MPSGLYITSPDMCLPYMMPMTTTPRRHLGGCRHYHNTRSTCAHLWERRSASSICLTNHAPIPLEPTNSSLSQSQATGNTERFRMSCHLDKDRPIPRPFAARRPKHPCPPRLGQGSLRVGGFGEPDQAAPVLRHIARGEEISVLATAFRHRMELAK